MIKMIYLIVGGAVGTLARYGLAGLVYQAMGTSFPYGTMAVNLAGCLIAGFLMALAETKFLLSSDLRILLLVGFCGAFTTFSTLILETDNLFKSGEFLPAIANILASVLLGLFVFRLGVFLGEMI